MLAIVLLFSMVFSVFVAAQGNTSNEQTIDDSNNLDSVGEDNVEEERDEETGEDNLNEDFDFEDEFRDEEISDAGIAPDSALYGVDEFFDQFGDELEVREEKVSEIKEMVEAGDIESARAALENYKEQTGELEKEVAPERRDEARRSAAVIKRTLEEIEEKIPEGEREKFVDDVIDKERKIVTSVEIASKIKDLCEQLSGLDPLEYSRICNIDNDSPEWQKRLDRQLTKEQEEEAKGFGVIMSECFKTDGKECRCEDISIKPFADRCSIVAPLAAACDGGDESSCEAMDDATEGMEDLLPDYLQDVMMDVERRFGEDQFDLHMPRVCCE
ncbi:MAG: hypothetical protein AABY22_24870 [Nanoarchaeota archaeon]